jgi:hypothetical protein
MTESVSRSGCGLSTLSSLAKMKRSCRCISAVKPPWPYVGTASDHPIRIFHGIPDEYNEIAPCCS